MTNDGRLELVVFATIPVGLPLNPPSTVSLAATASSAPGTIPAGKWSYVAGTYDGNLIRIFWAPLADLGQRHVKLTEVATPVSHQGTLTRSYGDAYIGRAETANPGYFFGRIDDVAFFPRALMMNSAGDEDLEGVIQWGHMTMPDHELLHGLLP